MNSRRELADAGSLYHLCKTSGEGFVQHTRNQKRERERKLGLARAWPGDTVSPRGYGASFWRDENLLELARIFLAAKQFSWAK